MEHYELGGIIGRGSSCVVREAVDRRTKKNVAIKQITVSDSVIGKQLTREMNMLMELKHPNIVSLSELLLVSKKEIWIVMDCYPQTLLSLIRQPNTLTADRIKRYLRQILEGVAYCHSLGVIHRDLKPANILINEASDSIKIADFGIARAISSSQSRQQLSPKCGTFSYMAPEVLLGKKYGLAADMWSIGLIFAELVTNKPLLKAATSEEMVDEIFRVFFEVTSRPRSWDNLVDGLPAKDFDTVAPTLDALGHDLLSCLLRIDPAMRLTAEQAVKHPYVLTAQEAHKHPY